MVVTDNSVASNVGRDVLAAGGNAADAAVATAFALAVAYPTAGNVGGGGFAVARIKGQVRALDFRETAPAAATRDMYLSADGKPKPEAREGIKSVGVPGSVAGLWELHQKLGSKKKTWAELLAPAIALAENGFVVDDAFLSTLETAGKRMMKYPVSAALFFPNGAPPVKGSTFKNPELATVLRRIEKGPKGFYEGPTADAIVAQMKADGGLITLADLKKYQAKWRTPIEFTYRGHKIVSMPPPSSGGVTLAMICHILEGYDLGKLGFQSPEELHYVFEAMRRAYAARNAKLGDPDFVKMPLEQLLSDAWAKEQRATIQADRATPSSEIAAAGPASASGPHTTHFSVVDAAGDTVALTTTINWWYGSGVTVKGAGFVLNNEMDDFAAVPGTANGFGLVQGEANAIAPGKRMLSSMAPTIVTAPDGKVIARRGRRGRPDHHHGGLPGALERRRLPARRRRCRRRAALPHAAPPRRGDLREGRPRRGDAEAPRGDGLQDEGARPPRRRSRDRPGGRLQRSQHLVGGCRRAAPDRRARIRAPVTKARRTDRLLRLVALRGGFQGGVRCNISGSFSFSSRSLRWCSGFSST